MNRAQKRAWVSLVISLVTLVISSVVIAYIWRNEINIYDLSKPTRLRILSLFCAIPLILIVITQWHWKKIYDERDRLIEHKANYFGIVGAFIFLGGAGWFLSVMTKMGSIKAPLIILLVYLACFVWILVSSAAALVLYSRGGKNHE
jgi:hypothetical protein